jgi:hypothetical protein
MNTARLWPYAGTSDDTSVIVSNRSGGRIRSGTSMLMAASPVGEACGTDRAAGPGPRVGFRPGGNRLAQVGVPT